MAVPTVEDLKVHANITSSTNDDELTDMLDAAVDVVAGLVGPIGATPVTETHYGVSSSLLLLRQSPVVSVTSIAWTCFGESAATMDPATYVLDPATGIVRLRTGGVFWGDVTVTYTAGRDDVPAAIRLGVLLIAAHLWETQRGTSPTALALQQQQGLDPSFNPGRGYAIPNRAQELLAPYIRPSVA